MVDLTAFQRQFQNCLFITFGGKHGFARLGLGDRRFEGGGGVGRHHRRVPRSPIFGLLPVFVLAAENSDKL